MSNKKDKIQETLDERLYRESGVKPVSKDHPIYKRGASIRFISKKNEKKIFWNIEKISDFLNYLVVI